MSSGTRIGGRPVPYQRVRSGQGRLYLPKRYAEYRDLACFAMRRGIEPFGSDPVSVSVVVDSEWIDVEFESMSPRRPKHIRGDIDNYLKAILDSAEDAGIIENDRQVMSARVSFAARSMRRP